MTPSIQTEPLLDSMTHVIRGITKLESGGIYTIPIPHSWTLRQLDEFKRCFNAYLEKEGIDIQFLFVPGTDTSEIEHDIARLNRLVDHFIKEIRDLREFVGDLKDPRRFRIEDRP